MKVHFAGIDCAPQVFETGLVNYLLESYISFKKNGKGHARIIKLMNNCKHSILDSGLFTMMFGAEKHLNWTEALLEQKMDEYAIWIQKSGLVHSVVEYDVQKIASPEFAWHLRKKLRTQVKNTVINVYHLEDGNPDKLVDFADYVAVSIPELRKHASRKEMLAVGDYILKRALSQGKRVHMLGCTEKELLKRWRDAYSCDSTSWVTVTKFNNFKVQSKEVPFIDKTILYDLHHERGEKRWAKSQTGFYYSIRNALIDYETWTGDQS